jgi:serine/threonine protein kinase
LVCDAITPRIVIIDFGFARDLNTIKSMTAAQNGNINTLIKLINHKSGTPSWLAPEVFDDGYRSKEADVYW